MFIGLDSTIPGSAHGRINEKQKKWLINTLADIDQDRNVVVLTHHPFVLFDKEILVNDEMSMYLLDNDQEIREIIEKMGTRNW